MKKQNKVVVAGAGTMGASLAQVYARAGWDTVLYNRSASGLERAKNLIRLNQETFVKEEILTTQESEDLLARIKMTTEKADFADAALVVENIVEDLDAKQAFWGEISQIVPEDALLATNTSGLHITDIAKACKYPERFMGQHWLNPPHLLPLCEIIAGEKTSPENVQKMRSLVESLGKQPVVVADINGFIINRIQFALLREALHIVDIGAATFEDVDTVLKAGMGLRYAALGPFGVADFGGLDTFDHINSYLNAELDDSKVGNKRLHEMVEAGKLGVKSGQGFYDYSGDKADAAIRERDRLYIELAKVLYFKK
ncbi:3-hydroxyacyl-CoA dehydrogenase family protein [Dysosmobacter sp.]|uniref:3-hydroxyacyl-CoA dehydrogenase family protein n=1 Tax=Dysosmobacter sp. TaxID=2591382 RepID=UPI003FD8A7C1